MTSSTPVAEEARIRVRVRADLAELVPAFLENRRREVAALPAALQAGEYSKIRSWAHNMAGTGGAFGFQPITELGRAMETAAIAADGMTINACTEKLADYLAAVEVVWDKSAVPQPGAAAAPAQQGTQIPPATVKQRGARVLVVDDNPDTLSITKLHLTAWGCAVSVAHDGEEAREKMQAGLHPDIMLLDWLMPLVSGIEILRHVRQLPLRMRPYVIMVTAQRGEDNMREGRLAGADDYMLKPVLPVKLRAHLVQAVQVLAKRRAVA